MNVSWKHELLPPCVPPETQFDNGQVDILLPSNQASCRDLQPAPRPCAKLPDVTFTLFYAGFVQTCLMLHLLCSTRALCKAA